MKALQSDNCVLLSEGDVHYFKPGSFRLSYRRFQLDDLHIAPTEEVICTLDNFDYKPQLIIIYSTTVFEPAIQTTYKPKSTISLSTFRSYCRIIYEISVFIVFENSNDAMLFKLSK